MSREIADSVVTAILGKSEGDFVILYKYYGFSAGMAALCSQKLGFRSPKYFNDPFELSYLDNTSDLNFVSKKMEPLKESLVILSLTRTPKNPLMWAHYGEDHKGFVIGYEIDDEFFVSEEYSVISALEGDVVYTSVKERIEVTKEIKAAIHTIQLIGQGEPISSHTSDEQKVFMPLLKKAFLYKHSCWSYEEEVRVVKVRDSIFEETHIWQSNPNRSFSSLSKLVAPGIGVVTIPGLFLYNKQANIKEVYLGMRNPLLSSRSGDPVKSSDVYDLSEIQSWSVKKMEMSSGSWELESHNINRNSLIVYEKTRGLINALSFSGLEAQYLSSVLPSILGSDDDSYELTNWSGDINLKKNGDFLP